jgi:hypothetical protein
MSDLRLHRLSSRGGSRCIPAHLHHVVSLRLSGACLKGRQLVHWATHVRRIVRREGRMLIASLVLVVVHHARRGIKDTTIQMIYTSRDDRILFEVKEVIILFVILVMTMILI